MQEFGPGQFRNQRATESPPAMSVAGFAPHHKDEHLASSTSSSTSISLSRRCNETSSRFMTGNQVPKRDSEAVHIAALSLKNERPCARIAVIASIAEATGWFSPSRVPEKHGKSQVRLDRLIIDCKAVKCILEEKRNAGSV